MNRYTGTTKADFKAIAADVLKHGESTVPLMLASKHGVPAAQIRDVMKQVLK
jgi:hypothetical protein